MHVYQKSTQRSQKAVLILRLLDYPYYFWYMLNSEHYLLSGHISHIFKPTLPTEFKRDLLEPDLKQIVIMVQKVIVYALLLLRIPGPVPFGTCICSNVETILSWTCHVYGLLNFEHPSVLLFRLFLWSVKLRNCWCHISFFYIETNVLDVLLVALPVKDRERKLTKNVWLGC